MEKQKLDNSIDTLNNLPRFYIDKPDTEVVVMNVLKAKKVKKDKIRYVRSKLESSEFMSELVGMSGGKCCRCGYNKCIKALLFCYRGSSKRNFRVGVGVRLYDRDSVIAETLKCELLCSNCVCEVGCGL